MEEAIKQEEVQEEVVDQGEVIELDEEVIEEPEESAEP